MDTTGSPLDHPEHQHDFTVRRAWQYTCPCGVVEYHLIRQAPALSRHLRWRKLYENGTTLVQIAERENVSPSTVWSALRRLGVQMRRTGPAERVRGSQNPERDAAIVARIPTASQAEIARAFGITRERVRQIAKREGIDVRAARAERSEATKLLRRQRTCPLHGPYLLGDEAHVGHQNSPELHPAWKERDAQLAADYAAGIRLASIMESHNVAASAVLRAVRREGIPQRNPRNHRVGGIEAIRARQNEIAAALGEGDSVGEIARRFDVSTSYVRMIARGDYGPR